MWAAGNDWGPVRLTPRADMRAFDRLPSRLREALRNHPEPMPAPHILAAVRAGYSIAEILTELEAIE